MKRTFKINWQSGDAAGWTDILPSDWFILGAPTSASGVVHILNGRGRQRAHAKCDVRLSGNVAELDYGAPANRRFNKKNGIYLGVMRVVFGTKLRQNIRSVEWRDQYGNSAADDHLTWEDADDDTASDIADLKRQDLEGTTKSQLVAARLGQGQFRRDVMAHWNYACAVTGIITAQVLRASHIKPWCECLTAKERLDPKNGLLLSANLDALFDKGLISFSDKGSMLVDREFVESKELGLRGKLRQPLDAVQKKYLKHHRDRYGFS